MQAEHQRATDRRRPWRHECPHGRGHTSGISLAKVRSRSGSSQHFGRLTN